MELKYALSIRGLLKIIEFIVLIIGFALFLDISIDTEEMCRREGWSCKLPIELYLFLVFTIVAAILTLVTFVDHLLNPASMNPITAKIAYLELMSCVISAILVLIGSSCLVSVIAKETVQDVTGCGCGFLAFVLLTVESAFLYRTASSISG
ncbi:uncharacterized protein LOC117100102 [Anneissia japonica]|uniref:uncharacterized protein LOC117100102 n=1 Tax=Anneissia japonica TaxID=1529436 RepID=UPI001425542E|nr:uncharacterized protein LOC117100102 [Anneissia japonica]